MAFFFRHDPTASACAVRICVEASTIPTWRLMCSYKLGHKKHKSTYNLFRVRTPLLIATLFRVLLTSLLAARKRPSRESEVAPGHMPKHLHCRGTGSQFFLGGTGS